MISTALFLRGNSPKYSSMYLDLERSLLEVIMLDMVFHGNRHFI